MRAPLQACTPTHTNHSFSHSPSLPPLPPPPCLCSAGLSREVISRVESGRFASSWPVLELYARSLVAAMVLPESSLPASLSALRSLWQNASRGGMSIIPPSDLRAAAQVGSSSGASGGAGGGAGGGPFPWLGAAAGSASGSASASAAAAAAAMGTRFNPVIVETQQRTSLLLVLARLLPYAVLGYVGYTMMGGAKMPGFNPLGGSDITEEVTVVPDTRFEDVKGCDEAKGELQDVVNFLRDPARYQRLGAKVPAGVLLTGPPGTGKTLLARAVAGEAGCKFYSKSASEFEEMLVGLGARRVRDLFAAAKKNAPAIIFIDEIDALGGKRRAAMGSGNERQTLNQLLACMDGFAKNEGVIVIAATNTPDILDPALTRPGRFDSAVDVPLPDVRGRREILDLYLSKCVVDAGSVSPDLLARATPGFSGAQLEALVNSAALMAAARGSDSIEGGDVEEARDKLIMGPSKLSRVRIPEQQRLTAYHEGGHTLVSMLTPTTAPLHKVTILPRGQSGGATFMLPNDTALRTKASILAEIDVSMGGRAAEELVYGAEQVTSGASGDMEGASRLARAYCTHFAMSEVGMASFSEPGGGGGAGPPAQSATPCWMQRWRRSSRPATPASRRC